MNEAAGICLAFWAIALIIFIIGLFDDFHNRPDNISPLLYAFAGICAIVAAGSSIYLAIKVLSLRCG